MKQLRSFCLFVICFFVSNILAQSSEITLKNATMSEPHYKDAGHNDNPMALINDPFAYEPWEPLAAFPEQRYLRNAQAQPKVEDDLTMSSYDPEFPRIGIDKNWYAAEIEIPRGKQIEYLDVWGRGDVNLSSRHRGLVIILENKDTRWYSKTWSGVSSHNETPADYGRFDFTTAGVTDNLLLTATKIIITKKRRNEFLTIAEIRMAGSNNPYFNDSIPPTLFANYNYEIIEGESIRFKANEGGNIYLVNASTSPSVREILMERKQQWICKAELEIEYQTEGLKEGNYKLYAIDNNNNISEASSIFTLTKDKIAPVINNTPNAIEQTQWISFYCNEQAQVFLVPENTPTDYETIINTSLKKIRATEGINFISSYNLPSGNYSLVAVDKNKNISNASNTITILQKEQFAYKEIPIISAQVGNFYYYLAKYGMGRFVIDDPFDYNPNHPMRSRPDQRYIPNIDDQNNWTSDDNDYDNSWLSINFNIPEGDSLAALDIWGRRYLSDVGTAATDEMAQAHQNLIISLSDSTHTWQSHLWSGVGTGKETGAFGRFFFSTADVKPQSLLKTATSLKLQHNPNNQEKLIISEVRLVHRSSTVAHAGPDVNAEPGQITTLDGSWSAPSNLNYYWTQVYGPEIYIFDYTSLNPLFIAPDSSCIIRVALTVSDDNNNEVSDTVQINVGTVNKLKQKQNKLFEIYPNPSSSGFYIQLDQTEINRINIYNTSGQLIYQVADKIGINLFIPPQIFSRSGTYFIQFETDNYITNQKIIVQ